MPDPKAIVFDVGNVLIDWQPERIFYQTIPNADERSWFMVHVVPLTWHEQQDLGRSLAEGIAERSARFPDYAPHISAFYDKWLETIRGPIGGSVQLMRELKQGGYAVHALTNFSAELWPLTVQAHPFLGEFDSVVMSGEEGVLKPDREIFDRLLSRTGLQAGECILIDDREDNVAAAAALGFRALHFTTPEVLRMDLVKAGARVKVELAG